MLKFRVSEDEVHLRYRPDFGGPEWVAQELKEKGSVTLSRVFHFDRSDLLGDETLDDGVVDAEAETPTAEDSDVFGELGEDIDFDELDDLDDLGGDWHEFRFASRSDGYFRIAGRILGVDNNVLIADTGLALERKLFVAERSISVFRHIADLLPANQDIVIGGPRDDSVPIAAFLDLIRRFPNTTELNRYAHSRISTVLGDYFNDMVDARSRYEIYMDKTRSSLNRALPEPPELLQLELQKYIYIHDTIKDWLSSPIDRTESDWQKMLLRFLLLIFPKYVAVLENVHVVDHYSDPGARKNRFMDLALLDASGNLDVIEVKKPFQDALVGKNPYRDNSIPARELAGSIMQAEKYLFHLSKWGVEGEKKLTAKYKSDIPPGMTIQVTNPKAMIIIGRDRHADGTAALDARQMFDLEVIKRKYANMMDIMTYDDLLRRLANIIASLRQRTAAAPSI